MGKIGVFPSGVGGRTKPWPRAVGGNTVEAALEAAEQMRQQGEARRRSAEKELEQAQYEARLAERWYEAVDYSEQRLVAAELEAPWNAALQKVRELERKLQTLASDPQAIAIPPKEVLLSLAQDLLDRHCTNLEAIKVVRRMAGQFSDELVTATLNRLGMQTGGGATPETKRGSTRCGTTTNCPPMIQLVPRPAFSHSIRPPCGWE